MHCKKRTAPSFGNSLKNALTSFTGSTAIGEVPLVIVTEVMLAQAGI